MDEKREDYSDPKRHHQNNRPKQRKTHNVLTNYVEILTAQIREEIYYSLISHRIFTDEQKGCRMRTSGTGKLLYVDKYILNKSKTRWKNLLRARIDNKKTYDTAPQSWILHSLKMYKIPDQVLQFIEKTMQT